VRPPSTSPEDRSFDDFVRRTAGAREIAVADAEQSVRFVSSHARQFGVLPGRVGMIGFSAGAMTTMSVAVAKDSSARPDFAVSLYGAVLTNDAPPKGAPPLFIAAAEDDPELAPSHSVEIFDRWTRASLPAELHIYEKGGHGFAFRQHHLPADRWPEALQSWLASCGYIGSPHQAGR
jgi:predicted esterase